MTITERRIGDVTLLELKGRLVFYDGAPLLRAHINELVDQARFKFVLNLRNVTYMDSFGVGVVAAKYVSIRRKGGDVRLLSLSPRCEEVLKVSGLLRIFQTFESEEAAVASFESPIPNP
jgi:anti-anti-sigma factor